MDWTRSEDILETAAALVGRPNSRRKDQRANIENWADSIGGYTASSPKTKAAAVPIVDHRDPETRALDELLEKWTGMKNPILETAKEIQRIHVSDPLTAKTVAELDARGAHSGSPIADFRSTGRTGITGNADVVSEDLAYDSTTGTFYMEKTPIPETQRLSMGLDEDKGRDLSETPTALSEEELKKQGDALCEAVEWLLVSQEKDTAIEAAEAILVRARMSEIQQCVSVIGFIEDEITTRSATIALINTQIAQLNELVDRAKNISDHRNPSFSLHLNEDGNDDDGEGGDWDAREQYPRENQNRHRFRQVAQLQSQHAPSHRHHTSSSLAETMRGASRPIIDEMYRRQQQRNHHHAPTNNDNRQSVHAVHVDADNPLPLGPTPPMSAAKQKMLAFALSPNSCGQQHIEHSSPASRGRLSSPPHVTTITNGGSMSTPRGRDQRQPFPPRSSLVASADEILEAASASAGGLTLAKMVTATPIARRTATANVLGYGITAATQNEAQRCHVGGNSRTVSRLNAIDAKLHAKLSLIGTSD